MTDAHIGHLIKNVSQISAESMSPLSSQPLVTLVVVSYNQDAYIEDTILSVLNQDYEPIELIVIDGGSTDGTLEILRKYDADPRFRLISEPDDGPQDGFNKGLGLARGELIGFQTGGDTYRLGAFAEAVQEFATDANLAMVSGRVQEIDEDSNPTGISWAGSKRVALVEGYVQVIDEHGNPTGIAWDVTKRKSDYSVDEIVNFNNYPAGQASFFRRKLTVAIGGFGHNVKWLPTFFFLHYMLEASRLGARSLRVPQHWANYRRHSDPLSHTLHYDLEVGLVSRQERCLACKEISDEYMDFLTTEQVRELRRSAYLDELRYRVGTLNQIIPAIPAILGYFRFGGKPGDGNLQPRAKGMLAYIGSFVIGQILHIARKRPSSSHPMRND